jgi:DNA-directed RNA polymerase specialized sigma24 family protein
VDGGVSTSFEGFVRRRAHDLLRTAVLLVEDRGDAEELLHAALVASFRHWRPGGDPYTDARHALVAGAVRRRRRRTVQQIVELPDESTAPPGPAGDDVVTAALTGLPHRVRAVLVLRFWEHLSAAATAEVLGCPVGSVERDTASALARLRADGPGDAADRLGESLAARAERVPPPRRDQAEAVVADHRRARRRRTAIVAAAVAAVLALGGVAVGSGLLEADSSRLEVAIAPAEHDLGVYEASTRGSLAGDESFVEGVRSAEWSAPMGWEGEWPEPAEADRRVLFAGEVPGGDRWALVMGRVGFQLLYVWFTGPKEAAGAALQPAAPPGRGGPDEPMTLMDEGRPAATLVVVGLPGDEVAFSADGSTWEPVPTDDGVAVGLVTPPASLAEAELRITRDGGDVIHRSALAQLRPTGSYLPPGAGPGPPEDPDGRQYGERMRNCLLSVGWVVTAAAGGGAFLAGADLGDPQRVRAFQQDRRQCEASLGYRD